MTAWDKKVSGGSVWYGEENDEYYWVTFTARVVSGQTYELYTYMSTHVKASSLAGLATAANNVGSDGKYAELVHVWVE